MRVSSVAGVLLWYINIGVTVIYIASYVMMAGWKKVVWLTKSTPVIWAFLNSLSHPALCFSGNGCTGQVVDVVTPPGTACCALGASHHSVGGACISWWVATSYHIYAVTLRRLFFVFKISTQIYTAIVHTEWRRYRLGRYVWIQNIHYHYIAFLYDEYNYFANVNRPLTRGKSLHGHIKILGSSRALSYAKSKNPVSSGSEITTRGIWRYILVLTGWCFAFQHGITNIWRGI